MMIFSSKYFLLCFLLTFFQSHGFKAKFERTITSKSRNNVAFVPYRTRLRGIDDDEKPGILFKEDNDKPLMDVKSIDEVEQKRTATAIQQTNLKTKSSATFGTMSIDELKSRMVTREKDLSKPLPKRTEDLNGINPVTPLTFSLVAGAMSFVGWKLSTYFAAHFAIEFVSSEIYPVQRLAIVTRNLVVGITTLASAFSGIVFIGLVVLGITVAVGVAKGELDPNKAELSTSNDSKTF